MMLAGLIGSSGWFYLANYAHTPLEATVASIVASLGVAVSDVVADSIVVEKVSRACSPRLYGIGEMRAPEENVFDFIEHSAFFIAGKIPRMEVDLRTSAAALRLHVRYGTFYHVCNAPTHCTGEGFQFSGHLGWAPVPVLG